MQRRLLIILIILPPLFSAITNPLFAQVSGYRLQQADSLYQEKRYIQSLEQYQAILNQKEFTPAMLLKMAYIEEGLNHIGKALYYLNLYYLTTNDKLVLDKMEELATKHNLDGYKNSDADIAFSFYYDYRMPISMTLSVMSILFLSIIFYRRKKGYRPVATIVLLFALLILLLVHLNVGEKNDEGIVGEPNTYLMDGPSAGASVIAVIDEGHLVEIVGKVDVWYEISWNGNRAFIKENSLLPVRL
ncbi:MAG: SH3 domain-containing protein [Cyclobacteriaceae bacterium]|nr:SH3 domain-containing protein [Cyclobacteriaceae bacterium]